MTDDTTYLIIADPMEQAPDVDSSYDAILCTGDLLELAPPPGSDPEGSVLDAVYDDTAAAYEEGPGAVLDAIQDHAHGQEAKELAQERYNEFLDEMDAPLYTATGNQDHRDVLEDVAAERDDLELLGEHDESYGFQGFVPAFADLPGDVFPSERTAEEFYDEIGETDATVLVAHSLPADFEPTAHGFERAYCSAESSTPASDDVRALESVRDGDHTTLSV